MYAEVVVDRPIIKYDRRDFVDRLEDASIPYSETVELANEEISSPENPLALTFHYHIPPHLAAQIEPGHLVAVPFRNRQLMAVVVGLSETSPVDETKPIAALLDSAPVLSPAQLRLARWLSDETLAPLATCIRHFLPPGSGRKSEFVLKPTPAAAFTLPSLNAPEQILLTYLRRQGKVPLAEVEPGVAEALIEQGLAHKEATLTQPRMGPKIDRTIELLIPPEEVEAVLLTLGRPFKQADLLLYLAELDDPLPALADVLAQMGCSREQVKALAERGWVEIIPKQVRLAVSPASRSADLNPYSPEADSPTAEVEASVIKYLLDQKQPGSMDEVIAATGASQNTLAKLVKKGLITRFDEAERLTLTLPAAQLTTAVIELRGIKKQAEVLRLLAAEDGPVWVGWVYAQTEANLPTLKMLASANLVSLDDARRWRDPLAGRSFTLDTPPTLSDEQQMVWEAVEAAWKSRPSGVKPILIHGVTGAGKTEIYLRAIDLALQAGQGAIMLVPEITLAIQNR